jgi:hypothetical protein
VFEIRSRNGALKLSARISRFSTTPVRHVTMLFKRTWVTVDCKGMVLMSNDGDVLGQESFIPGGRVRD